MSLASTSSGSLPGVSAVVCVAPFALVAGRAGTPVAGPGLAPSFCLANFDFDLAVLAFGLSGCEALPAFFGLSSSALAVPARAVSAGRTVTAVRPPPAPAAAVRAPLRGAGVPVLAAVALLPVGFPAVAVEPPARAGTALVPVFAPAILATAPTVVPFRAVDRIVVGLVVVGLTVAALTGAGLAGAAARALVASLSDVTAVCKALVAVEIAVSALVSVFADEAARVAAAFSLVEAEVTLVAADATVRGVTVVVRLAMLRAVLVAVLAPAVFAAGFAGLEVFAAPAVLAVRARELARTELATRTGAALAAVVFVGGTDLPPIWIS